MVVVLLAGLLSLAASSSAFYCPSGYSVQFDSYCLRLYNQTANLDHARAQCTQDGGYLTDIYDAKENNFLRAQLQASNGNAASAWIGLDCVTIQFNEPNYYWDSGNDPTFYRNLETDECDGSGYYLRADNGKWDAVDSSDSKPFFCRMVAQPGDPPTTPTPVNLCGDFQRLGDSSTCIQIVKTEATWQSAENHCASQNAHLLSIHNPQINTLVHNLTLSLGFQDGLHIGLSSNASSNSLAWTDGTPVDYAHYARGFPNDIFGHCTAMDTASSSGSWISMDCRSSVLPFICGRPTDTQPTTISPTPKCPENASYTGSGEITSPGYPDAYASGESCEYFLAVPEGFHAELAIFDFNTAENADVLTLYDGALGKDVIAALSGSPNGTYRTEKTNVMRLVWKTSRGGQKGWRVHFYSV